MKHNIGDLVLYKQYNEIVSVGTIVDCREYASGNDEPNRFYTITWNPERVKNIKKNKEITHEGENAVDQYRRYYLQEYCSS